MLLLDKDTKRQNIVFPFSLDIKDIQQQYHQPAKLLCRDKWIQAGCIKCTHPKCICYSDDEISCISFSDFSYERNLNVCPVDAIKWDFLKEKPVVDNRKCISCGLCATRCPIGAIYKSKNGLEISDPNESYVEIGITMSILKRHKKFIRDLEGIYWKHQFQKESDIIMEEIYDFLSKCDGRSTVPNVLVRNLLIALNHECAISRTGDVYTRMDAVYSSKQQAQCKGAIEIEFGRDTLEALRGILDDIAVLHSRSNLKKEENTALVVCLSFPNKRQGYFQVIKDVNKILGIKIQTISVGALLLLVWNGAQVNFFDKEFYVDFDSLSERNIIKFRLGRKVNLSNGLLGILEPEK